MARAGSPKASAASGQRSGLYSRAAWRLALGGACVFGAVLTAAWLVVSDSVEVLLDERNDQALTLGVLIEDRLLRDLDHLARHASGCLMDPNCRQGGGAAKAPGFLGHADPHHAFGEWAFLLGGNGAMLHSAPPEPTLAVEGQVFVDLRRAALTTPGAVVTPLVQIASRKRRLLLIMRALRDKDGVVLGFVGGALQPATTNLLDVFIETRQHERAHIDLLDRNGIVVASTHRDRVFENGDHAGVLSTAIARRTSTRGRCHGCHNEAAGSIEPGDEVLAFAPLPTLDLGIAVHQPEERALAPAFALRRRMLGFGLAFVALFLFFAGLSVRSVVLPVNRLTEAVESLESSQHPVELPADAPDEVGKLARAIELWRDRNAASLATAQAHEHALRSEVQTTLGHLHALQDIDRHCTLTSDVQQIADFCLQTTLSALQLGVGAMRIRHGQRTVVAGIGLPAEACSALFDRAAVDCSSLADRSTLARAPLLYMDISHGRLPAAAELGTAILAAIETAPGMGVQVLLGDLAAGRGVEERWVGSLLHHIGVAAANRILRGEQRVREQQRQRHLHKVLTVQEEERQRLARELHDTLAQDLAALRLAIEALSDRCRSSGRRDRLDELEAQTAKMLLSVRSMLLDLRPSVLEDMGFLPALKWRLERLGQEQSVRGTLAIDGDARPVDGDMAVTLFRIFQEAVQNAVLHGRASHLFVSVGFDDAGISLTVEDDGIGFAAETPLPRADLQTGRGFGLLGIEERADLIGGEVTIQSRLGEGTTIAVRAPWPHPARVTGEVHS